MTDREENRQTDREKCTRCKNERGTDDRLQIIGGQAEI
jgi:hypothetical protein